MENTGEVHNRDTHHTVITIIETKAYATIPGATRFRHRCLDCSWGVNEEVDW